MSSTNGVFSGATFPLQTFVGHEFELRELPSEKTGVCDSPDQTCRSATFVISENDNQGTSVRLRQVLLVSPRFSVFRLSTALTGHLSVGDTTTTIMLHNSHDSQLPPSLKILRLSSPTTK
jgi:hypothetical protein